MRIYCFLSQSLRDSFKTAKDSIKIPLAFLAETDKPHEFYMWKCKRLRADKIIRKSKLENSHVPISKLTDSTVLSSSLCSTDVRMNTRINAMRES
jgi:hypothetical protein